METWKSKMLTDWDLSRGENTHFFSYLHTITRFVSFSSVWHTHTHTRVYSHLLVHLVSVNRGRLGGSLGCWKVKCPKPLERLWQAAWPITDFICNSCCVPSRAAVTLPNLSAHTLVSFFSIGTTLTRKVPTCRNTWVLRFVLCPFFCTYGGTFAFVSVVFCWF